MRKKPDNRFDELIERHQSTAKADPATPLSAPEKPIAKRDNKEEFQQVSMLVRRENWRKLKVVCVSRDMELSEMVDRLIALYLVDSDAVEEMIRSKQV